MRPLHTSFSDFFNSPIKWGVIWPDPQGFFNTSLSGGKGDARDTGFFHNPDLL